MPQCVPAAPDPKPDHEKKVSESLSGMQLMYTGHARWDSAASQKRSVDRLASGRLERVPDAQRVMPNDVKEKAGILASYQWTGGGDPTKGFMH